MTSEEKFVPTVICVEGSIACGKTSLINGIEKRFPYSYVGFAEPVEQWKNVNTDIEDETFNLLDLYYRNPTNTSFLLQTVICSAYAEGFMDAYQVRI